MIAFVEFVGYDILVDFVIEVFGSIVGKGNYALNFSVKTLGCIK